MESVESVGRKFGINWGEKKIKTSALGVMYKFCLKKASLKAYLLGTVVIGKIVDGISSLMVIILTIDI